MAEVFKVIETLSCCCVCCIERWVGMGIQAHTSTKMLTHTRTHTHRDTHTLISTHQLNGVNSGKLLPG
jgi:hypothetical protein